MGNTTHYLERNQPIESYYSYLEYDRLVLSGNTVYNVYKAPLYKVITWVVANPTSGTTILGPKIHLDSSLTFTYYVENVYAYVKNNTNCVINIYYGDVGSTTTLLSSNLTVTTSESSTTLFDDNLYNYSWVSLRIVSVSGAPEQLVVSMALIINQNT